MYTTIPTHSILVATNNTSDSTFNHVSGFTGMVVLNAVGAILNLFAASYIAFTRKVRKRKSNKLLLNLLSSDMCVVVVHISFILTDFSKDINRCEDIFFVKPASQVGIAVTMSLSLFNLVSLTLDRLLAVKFPFFYQASIKTKHVYIVISGAWILSLIYFSVAVTIWRINGMSMMLDITNLSSAVIVLSGFVTLAVSNAFIYFEARKQLRKMSKCLMDNLNDKYRKKIILQRRESRIVRINVGMVAAFTLFWSPVVASTIYKYVRSTCLSLEFELILCFSVCCNFIFDPILYICLSYDVRKSIRHLLIKEYTARNIKSSSNVKQTQQVHVQECISLNVM